MSNKIGSRYPYMICFGRLTPVADHTEAVYVGLGERTPTESFTFGRHDCEVVEVLPPSSTLNPFPCDLVMARKIVAKKGGV